MSTAWLSDCAPLRGESASSCTPRVVGSIASTCTPKELSNRKLPFGCTASAPPKIAVAKGEPAISPGTPDVGSTLKTRIPPWLVADDALDDTYANAPLG